MVVASGTPLAAQHISRSLSLAVSAAVLGSAVLHATWNAITKSLKDQLVAFASLVAGAGVACALVVPFVAVPHHRAWPFLVVSWALHVGYQTALMHSYRVGDLSQAYPIARGSAPMIVAVLAVPLAHDHLDAAQIAGVAVVAGGLVVLAELRRARPSRREPAVLYALLTGALIASYSLVDGLGVRRSGTSLGYGVWLMMGEGLPLPLYAFAYHRARLRAEEGARVRRAAGAGLLSVAAYTTVLWAQTRAPLGAVAALRETGVIMAAVIGAAVFGERFGRRRVLAAALVAAGAALLNTG